MTLRRVRRLTILIVLVFALSGCLQVQMNLQVDNSNDTVSGQITLSAPLTEFGAGDPATGFAVYLNRLPKLPPGHTTVFPNQNGDYVNEVDYDHTPISAFNTGNMTLVHTGNQYIFTITLDPNILASAMPTPDNNTNTTSALITTTELHISVTLPGTIVAAQTTGTVVGHTVNWNYAANATKPTTLKAVAQVASGANGGGSGGSVPWLLIGALVLILLLAGALAIVLVTRRRPPAQGGAPGLGTPGGGTAAA